VAGTLFIGDSGIILRTLPEKGPKSSILLKFQALAPSFVPILGLSMAIDSYRLDGRGSILRKSKDSSLLYLALIGCGVHPDFYTIGTSG
jgi:hypothetical protein